VVAVTIEDSGPGMPHDEVRVLFEKYRQGMQSRTGDGTGLGLFIVKALIEAHGGQVTVESASGQGSCFSVLLPVAALAAPVVL
jgi:signal transduction histidine kinase